MILNIVVVTVQRSFLQLNPTLERTIAVSSWVQIKEALHSTKQYQLMVKYDDIACSLCFNPFLLLSIALFTTKLTLCGVHVCQFFWPKTESC